MKKFKKSIEINFENIKEVLNCPIVEGIHKEDNGVYQEGYGKPYYTWCLPVLDVVGFDLPFSLELGSVIALDVCGTWHAFTKKEWDKHKNDEI